MRRLQAACKDPSVAASYGWEEIEPASPIPRPIHDVVCVGVNYLDYSKEINSGKDVISIRRENHIIYFGKRASRILGDKGTVYPLFSLDKKTDCMISDVNEIISDFSAGITLEPGDIIATGTPAGVALGMEMPEYLKSGDEVVSEIEGIGTLKLYIR
ncbi:MAG: fumarylacetoacetate hydrolase family protein [Eubacteriales bacterium]|nr:fumarylacetoacetate hydrolase family protein [Eubacteriales bacterium]